MNFRRLAWALLAVLGLAGLVMALRARSRTPYPPDDPRHTVAAYLQALERRDYRGAYALWDTSLTEDEFIRRLAEAADWRQGFSATIGEVIFQGRDRATVVLYVTPIAEPPLFRPPRPHTVEAQLRRSAVGWRLVALEPPWGPVPPPLPILPPPRATPLPPGD